MIQQHLMGLDGIYDDITVTCICIINDYIKKKYDLSIYRTIHYNNISCITFIYMYII